MRFLVAHVQFLGGPFHYSLLQLCGCMIRPSYEVYGFVKQFRMKDLRCVPTNGGEFTKPMDGSSAKLLDVSLTKRLEVLYKKWIKECFTNKVSLAKRPGQVSQCMQWKRLEWWYNLKDKRKIRAWHEHKDYNE